MPRRAFTLVELLVVLAILSVLAGMIVPRMGRSLSRQSLTEAATRFAHTARTVRQLAIAQQQAFAIEISGEQGYQVTQQTEDGWQPVQVSWLRPQQWGEQVRLEECRTGEEETTEGPQSLLFFPDGRSNGARIRLSAGPDAHEIVVQAHNGRVLHDYAGRLDVPADQMDLGDP